MALEQQLQDLERLQESLHTESFGELESRRKIVADLLATLSRVDALSESASQAGNVLVQPGFSSSMYDRMLAQLDLATGQAAAEVRIRLREHATEVPEEEPRTAAVDPELRILQRIAEDDSPINTAEAKDLAPLARFGELKEAGLIDAAVVPDHQGQIVKVRVSAITYQGRQRYQELLNQQSESQATESPTRKGAFISYSTENKQWGGHIKRTLETLGISAFIAHDDLRVSDEWKERILEELQKADIFVALLSEAFKKSDWCAQEVG